MVAGCVPPYSVKCQPCRCQICTVNSDCSRRDGIQPKQRCRKGYETDGQEEENVDPQEYPIGLFDVVKLVVVADPIYAQYDKTERIGENIRRKIQNSRLKTRFGQVCLRKFESQDQDRHHRGEYSVS